MFFRVKRTGTYAYLQVVESFRQDQRVQQRVLATLGRLDVLQSTGQFDALLRSGLRFSQKLAVIDAHAAGKTEPVGIQHIGPDLVFSRLWKDLAIGAVLKQELLSRGFEFDVERAVYLTVIHRLFEVVPKRRTESGQHA